MLAAKPRHWNQAALANYLGGSEDEIATVRRGIVQLMKSYDAIHKSFKTKAAKNELKELLLSNLDKLPALVRDARTNDVRMEGLMGLAYKVNNAHKQYGREKMASMITNKPPEVRNNDDNDNGDDDESSSEESGEEDSSDDDSSTGNGPGIHRSNEQPRPEINGTGNCDRPSESRGHERTHGIRSDHSRSQSRANYSSPAVVVDRSSAVGPPNKRIRPSEPLAPPTPLSGPLPSFPQYQKPSYDLSVRNIWVVNEVDNESHGLCPVIELVKKDCDKNNLQLSDLDFDHWMLIVQAHCSYDYTIHRLEYRPSATIILPSMIGRPFTIPMRTPSQWRGALNSQLQAKPDQDPVFYLVSQCR